MHEEASAQYRRLLNTIGMRIVEHDLPAHAQLLTAQIAAEFGVSRSAMREVVRVLESMGMVCVRRRKGVEILPSERWNLYAPDLLRWQLSGSRRSTTRDQLNQLFMAVEPRAAMLAAVHALPEHRAALGHALQDMSGNGDRGDGRDHRLHDLAFHMAVLSGSGNPYFAYLADILTRRFEVPGTSAALSPRADRAALILHEDVANAIEARDSDAAAAAMLAIVTTSDPWCQHIA